MEWLIDNWVIVLITAVFIGMHLSGHGCCGHGKHEKHSGEECDEHKVNSDKASTEGNAGKKSGGCCD